jgi:hypothetical protein
LNQQRRTSWLSQIRTAVVALLLVVGLAIGATPGYASDTTGTITGTVKDSSGAAIAGAVVFLRTTDGYAGETVKQTVSASNGTFSLPAIPVGEYRLVIDGRSTGHQVLRWTSADSEIFSLTSAGLVVNASLALGATVTGSVLVDGAATAGVRVCIGGDYDDNCTWSNAAGIYTLKGEIGWGSVHWVNVTAFPHGDQVGSWLKTTVPSNGPNHAPGYFAVEPGETYIQSIPITSVVRVSGTVTDWQGLPVAGASVCVVSSCLATTDAAGNYQVSVPVGEYTAWATADGLTSEHVTDTLVSDGSYSAVNFQLPAGSLVSGRVTDWQGTAVSGAKICVSQNECVATTNADGTYSVRKAAGDYRAWAVSGALSSATVSGTLTNGQDFSGIDFQLAKPADSKLTAATPSILGLVKVGKKLTVRAGSWGPVPVKLSYRWYANGKAIKGATKSSYKVVKSLKGKKITVKVTGSKAGYVTVTKASKATKKVVR